MAWLRAGLDLASFWRQTPRTLRLTLQAATDRRDRKVEDMLVLAWQTACLQRAKKMPTLRELLGKKAAPRAQSHDEMRAAFTAWRAKAD